MPPIQTQTKRPKVQASRPFENPANEPVDFSRIIQPTIQFELYNPGDEAVTQEVDGEQYTVPGNSEYAYLLRGNGTASRYDKPGVLPITGTGVLPARTIVEFLVGPDGRSGKIGSRGIRLLIAGYEEQIMEEAYTAWVDAKRFDAINLTRSHEEANARATANKEPLKRPSRKVMEAYNWLAENDSAASLRFSCPICNWGLKYEQELHVHITTHHRSHPAAAKSLEILQTMASTEVDDDEGGGESPVVASGEVLDFGEGGLEIEQEEKAVLPIPRGLQNAGDALNRAERGEILSNPKSNRAGTKVVDRKGNQIDPESLQPTAAPVTHKGSD
jgi:hypothetical protein